VELPADLVCSHDPERKKRRKVIFFSAPRETRFLSATVMRSTSVSSF
jgi:hypothetical protein